MSVENYFEVEPGIEVHYVDKGKGQPLIFIPGWSFSIEPFEKQIDYFAERYRVIAVDPRSHGKSTISVVRNTYDVQGEDIAKLIGHLGLEGVIFVSWSFGGLTSWAYVEQQGIDHVKAVINIDVSPRSLSSDPDEWVAGTIESLIDVHNHSLSSSRAYRAFMEFFADTLLLDRKPTNEEKAKFIAPSLRIPHQIADALYVDGWLADKKEAAKIVDQSVPSIMFIASSRADTGIPYMKKEFPNTELHSFGHHMMFWEYPEKFNGILDEFFAKHNL